VSAIVTTFRSGASVVVVRGSFAGMHGTINRTASGKTRVDLWAWGVERPFAADALALTAARRATWPEQRQEAAD
jgi:transcription antitermination factor NusG